MAGTTLGGYKAAKTNVSRYGDDFYRRIGSIGGRKGSKDGTIKGFARNPALASRAGKIGGTISRRGKSKEAPRRSAWARIKARLQA